MPRFRHESPLPVDAASAFAWHERPGAFARLNPPWEAARLVERQGTIRDGDRAVIEVGPLRQRWVAEHRGYVEGRIFEDVQLSGPFAAWHHRHLFEPVDASSSRMVDEIDYRLPMGPLGALVAGRFVAGKLEAMFRYRHATLADDLARHAALDAPRSRVLVSGASGLVGRQLVGLLQTGGHEVLRLVRRPPRAEDELQWSVENGLAEPHLAEGLDAVVHLAGAGIADRRWSPARKELIASSRVDGTRALIDSLATLDRKPRAFVAASAIGVYGDRGDTLCDETTGAGEGFLAEVGQRWEAEIARAAEHGMREVRLRLGIVLSPEGGMLAKLLPIFKLGAGGPLAGGRQWISWVSIDDVLWIAMRALFDAGVAGPVNTVSPHPVRQLDFARLLGRVLRRPAFAPTPALAVRSLYGREMADETALSSTRVNPARLTEGAYRFRDEQLETALRRLLGRG